MPCPIPFFECQAAFLAEQWARDDAELHAAAPRGMRYANVGSTYLAGFGTFYAKHREAREVRNPRTGEKMMSKARTQAAFRPAAALKDI